MSELKPQERPDCVESIHGELAGSSNHHCGLYRLSGLRRQVRGGKGREARIEAKIGRQLPDGPFITLGRA